MIIPNVVITHFETELQAMLMNMVVVRRDQLLCHLKWEKSHEIVQHVLCINQSVCDCRCCSEPDIPFYLTNVTE